MDADQRRQIGPLPGIDPACVRRPNASSSRDTPPSSAVSVGAGGGLSDCAWRSGRQRRTRRCAAVTSNVARGRTAAPRGPLPWVPPKIPLAQPGLRQRGHEFQLVVRGSDRRRVEAAPGSASSISAASRIHGGEIVMHPRPAAPGTARPAVRTGRPRVGPPAAGPSPPAQPDFQQREPVPPPHRPSPPTCSVSRSTNRSPMPSPQDTQTLT